MCWITIILIFISLNCFSQNISQIKHLETISEITDTMALINKQDIDKINRTYFIKEQRKSRIFKIFSVSELAIIAILACFL